MGRPPRRPWGDNDGFPLITALLAAVVAGAGWFSVLVLTVDPDGREEWTDTSTREYLISADLFAVAVALGWLTVRGSRSVRRWLAAEGSSHGVTGLSELIGRIVLWTSAAGLVLAVALAFA